MHKGIHPTKNAKHIFPSVVLGMMKFARGRKEKEYDDQSEGNNAK